MDQPLFDIYFTGQLVEGVDQETAIGNVAKLFKSTPEKMAKLFTGKPQALKKGIDKAGAIKYKAALHQAGLLVAVKTQTAAKEAPVASAPPSTPKSTATSTEQPSQTTASAQAEEDWSLAAAGSDVLREDERAKPVSNDIDTSAIKMVSAFMEPEPIASPEPPPAPNTSHISVAMAGEDLLTDKPEPPPPMPLDLDSISLAPPGSDLEQIPDSATPLNPDISALSIADAGADLLEGQTKPEPPAAPDTQHLSIAKD